MAELKKSPSNRWVQKGPMAELPLVIGANESREILAIKTDARLKVALSAVLNQVGCFDRTVALLVDDDPVDLRLS